MSQGQGVMPLPSHCSKRMLWWAPWHSSQDCGSCSWSLWSTSSHHCQNLASSQAFVGLHDLWDCSPVNQGCKMPRKSQQKTPGACVVAETSIQVRWVLLQHSRPCRKQCSWLQLVLYTELWSNNQRATTALDLKWKYLTKIDTERDFPGRPE